MASTFSPLLQIELIGIGDQNNTWGTTTNTNLGTLIEDAIAGSAAVNVTAGNVTLSTFDGSADQARCAALRVTGTPGVSRNIIAPARSKIYVIANGSNAAVVLKTSTSTGLTIPTGEIYLAYFDTVLLDFKYIGKAASVINTPDTLVLRDAAGSFGANVIAANTFSGDLNGTINTLTTAVTQTAGNNSTKVATTAYVNSAVTTATAALGTISTQNANAVAVTGGTISGVTLSGTIGSTTIATTQTAGDNSTKVATTAYVNSAVTVGMPPGAVMTFAMNTAPTGWLAANGATVSRTTYASLFSAIGTTFGVGDGSTTFKLPDLRGYFARGMDNGRGVDTGRVFGSNQDATGIADQAYQTITIFYDNNDGPTYSPTVYNSGGGQAGTNRTISKFKVRPYNVALLYCIKI